MKRMNFLKRIMEKKKMASNQGMKYSKYIKQLRFTGTPPNILKSGFCFTTLSDI